MTQAQRQRIIVRTDAGLGTDENINWLLWGGYQVVMKGCSGPRAGSLAKQIPAHAWSKDPAGTRWIAQAINPPRFGQSGSAVLRGGPLPDRPAPFSVRQGCLVSKSEERRK